MDEKFFTDYFENYAKAYDDFNPEQLLPYYYAPTLMVKTGSVVALSTPDEILEHLKGLLASEQEHGYKKRTLAGLEVNQEGAWGMTISVHWIINHVDGSSPRDYFSTYNLFKQAGQWRILVTTNHTE